MYTLCDYDFAISGNFKKGAPNRPYSGIFCSRGQKKTDEQSTFAADPATKDESFGRFFADFQKAVGSGDKEKVASMINFESFTWEENENLQQVKTKEAFLRNYGEMFTTTIKKKIAAESRPRSMITEGLFWTPR